MSYAWVAFGSNRSDPIMQLLSAREMLAESDMLIEEAVSPIYRTPPWGYVEQPDFYNAVIRYQTSLAPQELLALLQQVELAHHRERKFKNAPRTLDLDILLYDDVRLESETLTIPHPRMHNRAFVLQPLADIDSEVNIGTYGKVSELLALLDTASQARIDVENWTFL